MEYIRALWFRIFPAMRLRNFQLFAYGQIISWSGNWLQTAAIGWQVKTELHGSAWQVGFAAALPQLSAAALAFFAGSITDRFDERRLIYGTQFIQMIQAFALGYLTLRHEITLGWIYGLSLILGITNALDRPTTHTLLMKITDRKRLRSGQAMNAAILMAGASIGGLAASILIPSVGLGGAYVANGISFLPVFWTLWKMELQPVNKKTEENPFTAIWAGWRYLWNEQAILSLILLNGIVVVIGFSYRAIFPIVTTDLFHGGSKVNGYLYAAVGIGALAGTMLVSSSEDKLIKEDATFRGFIITGPLMVGVGLLLFLVTEPSLLFALPFLALSGAGVVIATSTLRGSIQHHAPDKMRGRVMGFIFTIFLGGVSVGSWLGGLLAGYIGAGQTLFLVGISSIAISLFLFFKRKTGFGSIAKT